MMLSFLTPRFTPVIAYAKGWLTAKYIVYGTSEDVLNNWQLDPIKVYSSPEICDSFRKGKTLVVRETIRSQSMGAPGFYGQAACFLYPVVSAMLSELGFRKPASQPHPSACSKLSVSLPHHCHVPFSALQSLCSTPQGEQLHQGLSPAGGWAVGDPAARGRAMPGGPL